MIPPKPFILKCNKCGWRKRFAPSSDALIIGVDIVSHCPKCNSKDLEHKPATNRFLTLFKR